METTRKKERKKERDSYKVCFNFETILGRKEFKKERTYEET